MTKVSLLALASFCIFGAILLFQMATEKPVYLFHQNSKYAIINVSDPEMADAFANGEIVIKTTDPNAKTIIRVTSGKPTRINGKLESDGQLNIINPAGIIVGPGSSMPGSEMTQFGKINVSSTLETKQIPNGNVFALAIREGGSIRAAGGVVPKSE